MKIFINILLGIVLIFICLCLFFYWGWTSSSDPREIKKDYKAINIINNSNENICVIVNFCYSKDEVVDYNMHKLTVDSAYNRIDTICLEREFPNNHSYDIILPIKINEKVNFPKTFSLVLYNSDFTTIMKQISYHEFIGILKKTNNIETFDIQTLNEWTFIIDNTLFEIN